MVNLLNEIEGYVAAARTENSVQCWTVADAQNIASTRLYNLVGGGRPEFIPADDLELGGFGNANGPRNTGFSKSAPTSRCREDGDEPRARPVGAGGPPRRARAEPRRLDKSVIAAGGRARAMKTSAPPGRSVRPGDPDVHSNRLRSGGTMNRKGVWLLLPALLAGGSARAGQGGVADEAWEQVEEARAAVDGMMAAEGLPADLVEAWTALGAALDGLDSALVLAGGCRMPGLGVLVGARRWAGVAGHGARRPVVPRGSASTSAAGSRETTAAAPGGPLRGQRPSSPGSRHAGYSAASRSGARPAR